MGHEAGPPHNGGHQIQVLHRPSPEDVIREAIHRRWQQLDYQGRLRLMNSVRQGLNQFMIQQQQRLNRVVDPPNPSIILTIRVPQDDHDFRTIRVQVFEESPWVQIFRHFSQMNGNLDLSNVAFKWGDVVIDPASYRNVGQVPGLFESADQGEPIINVV